MEPFCAGPLIMSDTRVVIGDLVRNFPFRKRQTREGKRRTTRTGTGILSQTQK
jgi:hypothetical protein